MKQFICCLFGLCLLFGLAPLFGQDSSGVRKVGGVYNFWHNAYDVVVSGNLAFVAVGASGVFVLDITEPNSPLEIGSFDSPGTAYGLALDGRYLYLADWEAGFRVIDVFDPTNIFEVGFCDLLPPVRNIALSGKYAYVANHRSGLQVVDISDPTHPYKVANCLEGHNIADVAISSNYAYLADYAIGFDVMDISDPKQPFQVGHVPTNWESGWPTSVTISGKSAYLATDRGLWGIDISDPKKPCKVYEGNFWEILYDVAVSGRYAYTVSNRFAVLDLLTRELGCIALPATANGVTLSGRLAYVADMARGLRVISISNPQAPVEIGYFEKPSDAYGVVVSENLAYVLCRNGYLTIFDITNNYEPEEISRYNFQATPGEFALYSNMLYVAIGAKGLKIIDVTDPLNPYEAGTYFSLRGSIETVKASGHLYVGFSTGVSILSIRNPQIPSEIAFIETKGEPQAIEVSNSYLYLSCYNIEGLQVVDVGDPYDPVSVGRFKLQPATWIECIGSLAYMTTYNGGIQILDVSIPTEPYLIGVCGNLNKGRCIKVRGDYAYYTSGEGGVSVVNVANPSMPYEVGFYNTKGYADGLAIDENGLLYVADRNSFSIYDASAARDVPVEKVIQPATLSLSAYPNPFNPSTTITYSVNRAGWTKLEVLDVNGRVVTNLLSGVKSAGSHSVTWNASDVPAGTYILRLGAGEESVERTVTLVK